MSDLMDRIIADLVEGARRSEGFMRGGRATVEVARENRGRESKLAGHSGIGAAFGGPIGAALGADKGQEMEAAKGSFMGGLKGTGLGGLGGAGLGALVAALTGGHVAPAALLGGGLGAGVGGYAGSIAGASGAGDAPPGMLERMKGASLGEKAAIFSMTDPSVSAARLVHGTEPPIKKGPPPTPAAAKKPPPIPVRKAASDGALAALHTFGIKEAFIPMLAGLAARAAPMIGRALTAAKPVGNFLTKNPIGQQVTGTAASMGVQKMMTPSQPQQPGM